MVTFVNQLSLHGATADMIQGLPKDQVASERPVASHQTEQEILIQLPIAEVPFKDERQGNLLQDYEQRLERPPEDQKLSKLCSEAGLTLVEVGQFFCALPSPKELKIRSLCREYALPREDEEENCARGWIRSNERFGPVLEVKVCKKQLEEVALKLKFHLKSKTKPLLGSKL